MLETKLALKTRLLVIFLIGIQLISFIFFTQSVQASKKPHTVPPRGAVNPYAANPGTSVVLVHGLNAGDGSSGTAAFGDTQMPHCGSYWQDVENYLSPRWQGDIRQVAFYGNEYDHGNRCWQNGNGGSANLQDSIYANHCSTYQNGNGPAGSNNESLFHVSCLLAWYLYYNFGQYGWEVVLVGHSMGGLIVRETMYQVENRNSLGSAWAFPTTIGHVTDAITLNTPHDGTAFGSAGCNNCTQGQQMLNTSPLINELINHAQHPDNGGATDWTVVSSDCMVDSSLPRGDYLVDYSTATDINANHKVVFSSLYSANGCDAHGGIIHDISSAYDAAAYWCDNYDLSSPSNCGENELDRKANNSNGTSGGPGNWYWDQNEPHGTEELYQAVASYFW